MATCNTCAKTILFGGHKRDGLRFCGDDCLEQGVLLLEANALPEEMVLEAAANVHRGLCPVCGGSGPVDVHTSHRIWSFVFMSSWSSKPVISCRPCGLRRQWGGLFFSAAAGWWGFPWGFIMTPVQIIKNLKGAASPPDPTRPSSELVTMMRFLIVEQWAADASEKPE